MQSDQGTYIVYAWCTWLEGTKLTKSAALQHIERPWSWYQVSRHYLIHAILVLVVYAWWLNYPGRLLEHQFGYGVVYHPWSWSEIAWVAVGSCSSVHVARAPVAKARVRLPVAGLGFFTSSWLTDVDGMKDLWCSSTVWLLSTQIWIERSMVLLYSSAAISIDMNGRICGVLVATVRLQSTQA